jgi:hypothetical protein
MAGHRGEPQKLSVDKSHNDPVNRFPQSTRHNEATDGERIGPERQSGEKEEDHCDMG